MAGREEVTKETLRYTSKLNRVCSDRCLICSHFVMHACSWKHNKQYLRTNILTSDNVSNATVMKSRAISHTNDIRYVIVTRRQTIRARGTSSEMPAISSPDSESKRLTFASLHDDGETCAMPTTEWRACDAFADNATVLIYRATEDFESCDSVSPRGQINA